MNILRRKKPMANYLNEDERPYVTISAPRDFDMPPPEVQTYAPKEPMPDYVEPRPGVPPVGMLSAEALVKDIEKTAKNIETMADDLINSSRKCAEELVSLVTKYKAMSEDIRIAVETVHDTAAAYRDEAKTVFVRIEDTALMMQEVRDLSATMRARITNEPAVGRTVVPPTNLFGEDKSDDGSN